ncbi:MAG: polymer-forming cytoskeletal protein [Lachnospiraceae bacterium]|nr:polymer-forming cytoskeletal protein [Lachnospiraceae bacterium]
MSFLKDFREELSQAVNELVNGDDTPASDDVKAQAEEKDMARESSDNSDNNIDMAALNEIFGNSNSADDEDNTDISDDYSEDDDIEDEDISMDESEENAEDTNTEEDVPDDSFNFDNIDISDYLDEDDKTSDDNEEDKEAVDEKSEKGDLLKDLVENIQSEINDEMLNEMMKDDKEEKKNVLRGEKVEDNQEYNTEESALATEETAEVTKGTMIEGNIVSEGSMNIYGKIKGNVACRGKLVVCGTIIGSSRGAEIFTNNARIDGDVTSDGNLKIGNGTVIIGNVYGSSAVIAGAIQGDVDIHGPVIIDGTAVIQGNIRSRSVQVNNGAAIEGMISQCYAEVDYAALFDKTFSK